MLKELLIGKTRNARLEIKTIRKFSSIVIRDATIRNERRYVIDM